jgi:hypothetical protein
VGNEGFASDFVQDFGQLRFQARAFAGGHDGNGDARGGGFCRECGSGFLHFFYYTLWWKSSEGMGSLWLM